MAKIFLKFPKIKIRHRLSHHFDSHHILDLANNREYDRKLLVFNVFSLVEYIAQGYARLWNKATDAIKNSESLYLAKINIKKFAVTQPI